MWASCGLSASEVPPSDAGKLTPEAPPNALFQKLSPSGAFVIQTDVSKEYLHTLCQKITDSERKMLNHFKIPAGFLKGNDRQARIDPRFPGIRGDLLSSWGYKPWIEVRVFHKFEDFADEYFDLSDRLVARINHTPIKKETPEERAVRRLTEGVPGAAYWRISDHDNKYYQRLIRAYVGAKNPDEVAADLLHEMGHLFLETFLLEFAGSPKKGQEAEKRGTPAWISEGVAQLFQVNWATSKEAAKKRKQYHAMMYVALKAGDAYPFSAFMNVTNAHNLQAVADNPLKATLNYAQSYSVLQYMVDMKWQPFLQFLSNCRSYNLDDLTRGKKKVSELYSVQERAFEDAFGVPFSEVEEHWKKHVIATLEKELKRDPSGHYWCGEYYLRRKGTDYLTQAAARFKLAIEGAPKSGAGYLGMGRVGLVQGETETALKNLRVANKLSPRDEDVWYYLGVAQMRGGKAQEATASFEKAVALYPLFQHAHAGRAAAYFETRAFKKAAASYEAAHQISKQPQYLYSIGQAYFFDKDYTAAQKNFAAYCQVFPRDAQGQFWYGIAAQRLNQQPFAAQKLEEAVQLEPTHPMYKNALALARKGEQMRFSLETEPTTSDQVSAAGVPTAKNIEAE